jgi:6-phosphogluconolactonase
MKKLRFTFIVLLSIISIATFAQSQIAFYVGTGDKSDNSVITLCHLDPANGKITVVDSTVNANGPGYVAIAPDKKNLYAVSGANKITSFAIQPGQKLKELNSQSSEGANPCHVSVHPSGKMVFLANYTGGSFSAYPLNADGSVQAPSYTQQFTGSGPHEKRQEKAHAHFVTSSPNGKYVYVTDLGSDKIMNYVADVTTGKLSPNPAQAFYQGKPGAGPRHFAITPSGKFIYLLNELEATVTSCTVDSKGIIKALTTYQTVPAGITGNTSAAVHIHPNGKFVYVSNRGHNSISAFRILSNGELEKVDEATKGISIPRDFNFDPSGKYMIVGNQDKNNLTVYTVDDKTGKLSFLHESVNIKAPICIAFL